MRGRALLGAFIAALFILMLLARGPQAGNASPEFFEYENIVLAPFTDPEDSTVPDWRELYIAKIEKYEAYLKKYPNSPLVAEVKLRIAELAWDVEQPEIHGLRVAYFGCLESAAKDRRALAEKIAECSVRFQEQFPKQWRDPIWKEKARILLLELVRDYGYTKRYSMEAPRIGGFRWIEEEIGARALWMLSQGTDLGSKKKILLRILEEYKVGPKLRRDIEGDLEKLKDVRIK